MFVALFAVGFVVAGPAKEYADQYVNVFVNGFWDKHCFIYLFPVLKKTNRH